MIERYIPLDGDQDTLQGICSLIHSEVLGIQSHVLPDDIVHISETIQPYKTYYIKDWSTVTATGAIDLKHIDVGVAELQNVAVHRDYRCRGLGRLMVGALETAAKEHNAYLMRLSYLPQSRQFYERLQYVHIENTNTLAKRLM